MKLKPCTDPFNNGCLSEFKPGNDRKELCLYLLHVFQEKYLTEKPKQDSLSPEDLDEAQIIFPI